MFYKCTDIGHVCSCQLKTVVVLRLRAATRFQLLVIALWQTTNPPSSEKLACARRRPAHLKNKMAHIILFHCWRKNSFFFQNSVINLKIIDLCNFSVRFLFVYTPYICYILYTGLLYVNMKSYAATQCVLRATCDVILCTLVVRQTVADCASFRWAKNVFFYMPC